MIRQTSQCQQEVSDICKEKCARVFLDFRTCRLRRPPLLPVRDECADRAQPVPDRQRHVVADHAQSVAFRQLLLGMLLRRGLRDSQMLGPVPVVRSGELLLLLVLLQVVEARGAHGVSPRLDRVGVRRAEYPGVDVEEGEEGRAE